ncbi:ADP-ribosylation factor-like protein 6-interacting protein 6 isoform X2 [Entelurus aequoreus]|uniref:ADP-ribosylation factor-like protein 6-interacting protein 6 isoform X2 n=1 Tax=Entelurus aequoreus TaxID=161455 RepID=UPI002B1D4082|nr:ADP-ribosylation factor-like protein 6-interacting protein 6 isoform X2 [Entelurus aequoreus]
MLFIRKKKMEHPSQTGTVGEGGVLVKHSNNGFKLWPEVLLSVVVSAAVVAAVGLFCAFLHPILQELQAERVMEEDGTVVRMLGFRSILVLSVLAGIMCCFFSWTLAYLNAYKPGMVPLTGSLLYRDTVDQSLHFDYGVAFLNGAMATLTVIWSLT